MQPKSSNKKRNRRRRNRSNSLSPAHHDKMVKMDPSSKSLSQNSTDCDEEEHQHEQQQQRYHQCSINYPNGAHYEGSILIIQSVDGTPMKIRDGYGIYIDPNHNCHEGLWRNDLANGHGVKEFITGDRHEGGYVKDKRHGWGK